MTLKSESIIIGHKKTTDNYLHIPVYTGKLDRSV